MLNPRLLSGEVASANDSVFSDHFVNTKLGIQLVFCDSLPIGSQYVLVYLQLIV